jgi:hypothetical protein
MRRKADLPFFRPGDIVVLLLILVPVLVFTSRRGGGEADSATIVASGGWETAVSLGADTLITVEGQLGEMVLETSGGRIRVVSAPCPGQHCVSRGWAGSPGDVIVCVPSEVYVRLDSGEDGGVDAVSY